MHDYLKQRPALAERIAFFSAWVESQIAYQDLPGLAVGLVYDQDLVWAQGFGYADLDSQISATPHTLYRIASITKLFTSTALLQLRDAGRLQLDDPVQTHLPWFDLHLDETMPGAKHRASRPVTVRHLLTHTGGLRREAPFPYWTEGNYPSRLALQESLPNQPAAYPPETRWKYSNLGLSVAGEIVEQCAGMDYVSYIHNHVLAPLGMDESMVAAPRPDHPQLAAGYSRRLPGAKRERSPHTDAQGLTPAFNMSSSVHDLALFLKLQLRVTDDFADTPGQILHPQTLREMQRVHWLEPNWQTGWGLGFSLSRQKDVTWVGHGGAVLGYRTSVQVVPEKKMGGIILGNADDFNPFPFMEKLFAWVGPYLDKPAVHQPADTAQWQPYLGRFRNAWRDVQSIILDGKLALINPSLPDPLPELYRLNPVPGPENVFRISAIHGFGVDGEYAIFEFDPAGQLSRLKLGDNYLESIARW